MRAKQIAFLIAPACLATVLVLLFFAHSSNDTRVILSSLVARLLKEGAPLTLLAIGAGMIIAAGYIDLSVTGVATAAGVIFATLIQLGFGATASLFFAVCCGALSGLLLGNAIIRLGSPSLILSWALGVLWTIASIVFAGSHIVNSGITGVALTLDLAPTFYSFGGAGCSLSLSALIIPLLFFKTCRLPNFAAAVGGSVKSSLYSGIRTNRVIILCYIANGVLAALSGILWSMLISTAATTDHIGKELMVIAIAVFGGTSMSGGVLCLESILCSALFWAGAKTWIDGLDLEAVGNLQQHAANALFACVFIVILLLVGRRFDSKQRTIRIAQEGQNL